MSTNESASAGPVLGGGPILSPLQIIDSLEQTMEKAKSTGDLKMYESQTSTVEEHGVQVC
jgi:hypothetical protein